MANDRQNNGDDKPKRQKHPWAGKCTCLQDIHGNLRVNATCPIHGRHFDDKAKATTLDRVKAGAEPADFGESK